MPIDEERAKVSEFLRANRKKIVRRWELSTLSLASGRATVVAVRNNVPVMVDAIADACFGMAPPQDRTLSTGFDLREVVEELTVLRRVIADLRPDDSSETWLRIAESGIDEVMLLAIDEAEQRRRVIASALEDIAAAAFGSTGLDDLLARLVELPREQGAAETVVLYLVDRDLLRMRAASGVNAEVTSGIALAIGEGFAGRVAAESTPLELKDAMTSVILKADPVRAAGVRCVYGVPLLDGARLVGVVQFGSRTAPEFTEGERRFFRAFAAQAATAISHHELRAALDRERDDLVNAIAHDLKTPMQAIGGYAELMRERREKAGATEEVEWLRKMSSHVERMNKLLSELLDVRLLATGRLPVTPSRIAYGPLLEEVVSHWTLSSPQRAWKNEIPAGLEVIADRLRVSQVLDNLISNAVKYSGAKSTIAVRAWSEGKQVITSVADQGIGLPKEQWATIFRRYSRAPGAGNHAKGYGIGLYVSAELVAAMGGKIWLESAPGKGSTFFFSLPAP